MSVRVVRRRRGREGGKQTGAGGASRSEGGGWWGVGALRGVLPASAAAKPVNNIPARKGGSRGWGSKEARNYGGRSGSGMAQVGMEWRN